MATGLAPTSDIAARAAQIVSTDSPIMRKAAATGMATANRRGLINSTMGIGAAQDAVLGVAVPIASQESSQAATADNLNKQITSNEGMAARDITSREKVSADTIKSNEAMSTASIAAQERERQLSAQVQLSGNYQTAITNTLQNNNIPAAERQSIVAAIKADYQSALAKMSQLYGVTPASGGAATNTSGGGIGSTYDPYNGAYGGYYSYGGV